MPALLTRPPEPPFVAARFGDNGRTERRVLSAVGRSSLDAAIACTAVFLLVRAVPGDLAAMVLGEQADAAARAALQHRLGLDTNLFVQYAHFWKRLLSLDWGTSLAKPSVPVQSRLVAALGPTMRLALCAVAMAAAWGVPLGMYGARHQGRARSTFARAIAACLASVPLLATAPVLLYLFCVKWQWVPLPGDSDSRLQGLLFASGLLALPLGAHVARAVYSNLLELRRGPCLRVARAKGASLRRMWLVHALPLTAGVVLTLIGAQLGAILGGAMVVERLFERRGLGTLILESYRARDVVVLEAAVVTSSLFFVGTQTLFHVLFLWIDPRAART